MKQLTNGSALNPITKWNNRLNVYHGKTSYILSAGLEVSENQNLNSIKSTFTRAVRQQKGIYVTVTVKNL